MRLHSLFALVLTAALTIGLSSCGDDELPVCIDNILTDFRTEACDGGELTSWTFKGELVYCFDYGVCMPDKTIDIYRENCELVCGFLPADGLCDGTSWSDSANLESTIYTK